MGVQEGLQSWGLFVGTLLTLGEFFTCFQFESYVCLLCPTLLFFVHNSLFVWVREFWCFQDVFQEDWGPQVGIIFLLKSVCLAEKLPTNLSYYQLLPALLFPFTGASDGGKLFLCH